MTNPHTQSSHGTDTRLLVVVCLGVFASAIAWRAVDPMLPVMARDLNVGMADVVLLASAYSFPLAIMQLILGPVGDAWGKARVIRLSLAMVAVSLVWMALAPGYFSLMCARVLGGAFAGGVNPVSLALIGERIPYEKRQVALGRFLAAMITGQMLGAAAAGVLVDLIGWRAVFATGAVAVALVWLLTVFLLDLKHEPKRSMSVGVLLGNYRSIFGNPMTPLICGTLIVEGIFVLSLIPFVSGMVLLHAADGSAPAGIVIACFAVGGMAFGFLVRRVLGVLGPQNMLRAGGSIAGMAMIATAMPLHWTFLTALFFLIGFAFYMFHNVVQIHVTELAPDARGAGVSIGAFCFMLGQGLGPLLWAPVAELAGYRWLFAMAGTLAIITGFVVAALFARRLPRQHQPAR
jgi:DHA1 family inner membrane transport protein